MSERRKTKEKQLNEVGSRAGGVGGNASGLANRVGSAVVITRPKPSSSSSAGIFARRDGMTSGRGFPRGGVLVVDVDGDGAISLRGEVSSRPKPSSSSSTGVLCVAMAWYPGVGAFAWRSDGGELEAKDGGGGYGMMCGEVVAVTWLCKRKLVHTVATDVHFKKKKKLIWLIVTRLVTIVVAVGIVGDEMHEVVPLENLCPNALFSRPVRSPSFHDTPAPASPALHEPLPYAPLTACPVGHVRRAGRKGGVRALPRSAAQPPSAPPPLRLPLCPLPLPCALPLFCPRPFPFPSALFGAARVGPCPTPLAPALICTQRGAGKGESAQDGFPPPFARRLTRLRDGGARGKPTPLHPCCRIRLRERRDHVGTPPFRHLLPLERRPPPPRSVHRSDARTDGVGMGREGKGACDQGARTNGGGVRPPLRAERRAGAVHKPSRGSGRGLAQPFLGKRLRANGAPGGRARTGGGAHARKPEPPRPGFCAEATCGWGGAGGMRNGVHTVSRLRQKIP
ncbi:hypothetical protein EDB89DRAFT_2206425 [Lactarius sanguifluus]|nr:hypothetical protein EDB89DRAFT_2206425 [Lactarius sanguifluus]